jgi:hypothetical protein
MEWKIINNRHEIMDMKTRKESVIMNRKKERKKKISLMKISTGAENNIIEENNDSRITALAALLY